MPVLALDVGGTKLAAALVDDDGVVLRSARRTTPAEPWPACLALLEEVADGVDVDGVGAGCGGPMRWPDGVVSPLNMPSWTAFPLRERLSARWPGRPVRVHNDAVCAAVGEHWRGAGQGERDLLGVVVSTGVGAGLVLGGRVLDGATGSAGHVGHVVVEPDGPVCGCGGRGCLEAIARGPAVVAWARERGCAATDGRELAGLAADGDRVAVQALARAGRALGVAFASAAALLDLRRVAVGGGLSQAGPPLWTPMREAVALHARLPFPERLSVVPAGLGQEAGLVGAAALVLAGDRYWSPGDDGPRAARAAGGC
ncbi:MAG TPA: ROK family protein [Mycobacteriales bacterium]|nr:ROK family protein [Mycobacteriales bacterium]